MMLTRHYINTGERPGYPGSSYTSSYFLFSEILHPSRLLTLLE